MKRKLRISKYDDKERKYYGDLCENLSNLWNMKEEYFKSNKRYPLKAFKSLKSGKYAIFTSDEMKNDYNNWFTYMSKKAFKHHINKGATYGVGFIINKGRVVIIDDKDGFNVYYKNLSKKEVEEAIQFFERAVNLNIANEKSLNNIIMYL